MLFVDFLIIYKFTCQCLKYVINSNRNKFYRLLVNGKLENCDCVLFSAVSSLSLLGRLSELLDNPGIG
jgi:hypothetical protein